MVSVTELWVTSLAVRVALLGITALDSADAAPLPMLLTARSLNL